MNRGMIDAVSANRNRIRFLLDSGAFTAHTTGREIRLDDYCKFIESLPFKPWRYFSLDVIGDPEKTRKNYDTMVERGFSPIPIFTQNDDISSLEYFYSKSDVVGLGGLVTGDKKKVRKFVAEMMRHVNGRRVHWLGFTDTDFVNYYRPYMCDSSGIQSALRFGSFILYKGNGKTATLDKKYFASHPSHEVFAALRRLGIDTKPLSQDKNWRGNNSISNRVAVGAFVEKSMDIFSHLGTRLFLAICLPSQVPLMVDFHRRFESAYSRKTL